MTPARPISRRSFFSRVAGVSTLALGGCTINGAIEESPYDPPPERGPPEGASASCTDGDSGRYHDAPGNGRTCRGRGRHRPPRHD
jgi:hypothetical protein